MIRLINLNKYYKNSLHVIDNTSLELPNNGLITFLGKSGSGKTTLLNVVGGLDKANSGTIQYEDFVLTKYNMHKIDVYRRKNVGYIFQNYLLLEELSVYDNLKEALELIGITDKTEQKARIEYALNAVGLYKYRKKKANRLSGGQMQRVSIARALVKKCQLIIADEPTGNLDSENTIEVMNILKKISETTLVLLVTHNPELAAFYSDRIITIKDGKVVSDEENTSSGVLNAQNDRKIYLKDLTKKDIVCDNAKFEIYAQTQSPDIDLKIIIKNDTIYIDTTKKVVKTSDAGVELIDDHYRHLEVQEIKDTSFDISWYQEKQDKNIFTKFFNMWKKAFNNYINVSRKTKIFRIIFIIIGVIMGMCAISLFKYTTVDDKNFCNEKVYTLTSINDPFYFERYDLDFIKKAIDKGYIKTVYPINQDTKMLKYQLNSVRSKNVELTVYSFPDTMIKLPLHTGKMPKAGEVVIGKKLADIICDSIEEINYQNLIGIPLLEYLEVEASKGLIISGISSEYTTSIYFNTLDYNKIILNSYYYDDYDESSAITEDVNKPNIYDKSDADYNIVAGRDIASKQEIIVAISEELKSINEIKELTVGNSAYLNNKEYKIVGEYKTNNNEMEIVTTDTELIGKYIYLKGEEIVVQSFDVSRKYHVSSEKNLLEKDLYSGKLPASDNEVVVNKYLGYEVGDTIKYNGNKLKVVGKVNKENYNEIYTTEKMTQYLNYAITESNYFDILKSDESLEYFKTKGYKVETPYEKYYTLALKEQTVSKIVPLVFALIMFIVSILYVYFSTRSRIISDIKTIGIYRSMGATRLDIVKNYFLDIILETTFTSLLGYIVTMFIYSFITEKVNTLIGKNNVSLNPILVILGIVVIYIINIIFGLIPVFNLLRKTPSEINSKYDI